MKLSELTPCCRCQKPLGPVFIVVRISQAMIKPQAAREVVGMAMILGGLDNPGALRVAEAMTPRPDEAVLIFGDEKPELMTEVIVCQECYLMESIDLCSLVEMVNRRNKIDQAQRTAVKP